MRVPIAWLREFVDLPSDVQAIADRLAMLGFPVAEIEQRPAITGVVAGKIVALEKHPNADRLQVGQIDIGADKPLTIATAATNVALGQTIPVAMIGARLPQLTIEPRKMRGIASEGMMISAEELALTAEWFEDGIMQLEPNIALGTNVVELFGLDLAVLDVEITSNRVDAMSMLGLARELAASYRTPLREPSFVNPGRADEPAGMVPEVTIASPDCTRYVAQRFDGLAVQPAPAWMRIRLALAGQRPINNLVDISNYVMLETGQPLHFYDAAHVPQSRLIVRDAREGERMTTLDGVERTLTPQALLIAGEDDALCLAGLMGGTTSEVNDTTTAIILEAANFNGARVRRMSMQLGLRSEASSRHEKALAPALTDIGAARAARLLTELGATAYRTHEFGAPIVTAPPIPLRVRDVERLLGLSLDTERIAGHLEALGCLVVTEEHGTLAVTPPLWRRDLSIAADLVEEIARMEGYESIESSVPSVPAHEISSVPFDRENAIAQTLVSLGYDEIITQSLHGAQQFERVQRSGISPAHQAVEVLNPLSEEQRFLRSGLVANLVEYFATIDEPVRIFEIGHVFNRDDGATTETNMLAFGFVAEPIDEPAWRDSNFLRLKGDAQALLRIVTGREAHVSRGSGDGFHPGKTAALSIDGRAIALAGRVDPRLAKVFDVRRPCYLCTIDVDTLPAYALPHYVPPSKFPSTYRDLALTVDLDVSAAEIERTIAQALGALCTSVRVFDEYRGQQVGAGRKSLAVRITMQRFDGTITDEEADRAISLALEALRTNVGATIRE